LFRVVVVKELVASRLNHHRRRGVPTLWRLVPTLGLSISKIQSQASVSVVRDALLNRWRALRQAYSSSTLHPRKLPSSHPCTPPYPNPHQLDGTARLFQHFLSAGKRQTLQTHTHTHDTKLIINKGSTVL